MKTTLAAGLLFVASIASANATQWVVRWGDTPRDNRGYSRMDRHMGRRMPAGAGAGLLALLAAPLRIVSTAMDPSRIPDGPAARLDSRL